MVQTVLSTGVPKYVAGFAHFGVEHRLWDALQRDSH